jgi:hypothetical protein
MRIVREKVAERKLVAWADSQGVLSIKLNLQGRRGWPDRAFFLPGGRPYLVELKAEGEVPRKLQAHIHSQLRALGYSVAVCASPEEAVEFMKRHLSLWRRFWEKVDKRGEEECWEWRAAVSPHGYGVIGLGGRGATETAHRVSWMFAHGPILEIGDVMHKCNNKLCVNPGHLQFGTRSQNLADAYRDGLRPNTPRGETHSKNKLTEEQALLLLDAPYGTNSALCRKFGVSPSIGTNIRAGRIWKHLKEK